MSHADSTRTALRIYRLAAARLYAANMQPACSEDVFAVLAAIAPDRVSYGLFEELCNEDFLHAVYYALLGRAIDSAALHRWKMQFHLSRTQFRTAVLHTVLTSPEYRMRSLPLTDCPLPIPATGPQVTITTGVQGLPPRLVRIYRALPPFLQRMAKRIAGKE
ncbi:MAG: hypothetical protein ACI4J3_02860 [Oscillospiraceae bacterium]